MPEALRTPPARSEVPKYSPCLPTCPSPASAAPLSLDSLSLTLPTPTDPYPPPPPLGLGIRLRLGLGLGLESAIGLGIGLGQGLACDASPSADSLLRTPLIRERFCKTWSGRRGAGQKVNAAERESRES
eukprot:6209924-Pleurochrysis_carterae.AAC.2